MCHYITAILPGQAILPLTQKLAEQHHRKLEAITNRSVQSFLKPGERYFTTTRRGCDCGTTLGYLVRKGPQHPQSVDTQKVRAQLARKGWSPTKIARWLEQKERDARSWQTQDANMPEPMQCNQDWFDFIANLLHTNATPYIGLLLHWYSGPLSGRLPLKGREVIYLHENGLDALARMQEDTIYQFVGAQSDRYEKDRNTPSH